jgi:hypothetical protein
VSTTAPADAREAPDMVRAGLGYLAAADPGQLPATTQAECLRELEQHDGTRRTSSCWPRPPGAWAWPTRRACSRRCASGPGETCRIKTRAGSSRTGR